MPAEVELKLRASGAAIIEALAAAETLGEAILGPPLTFDEVDVYLDTRDGRLAAAGWACRLRDRGAGHIVSLKGPADAISGTGIHRRPEHEGPATESVNPDRWPPSAARERLLGLSGGAPLVERVRLLQRRTERSVSIDGVPIGTLSLDEVRVRHGAEVHGGPIHVVELELAAEGPGSVATLERLAASLSAHPGLQPDPDTKLAHALAIRDAEPDAG